MGKKLIKDEKGMAMVAVMMALLVVSILGAAAVTMAASNVKVGLEERELQAAYYIAEAGATYYMESLRSEIMDIYGNYDTEEEFFDNLVGKEDDPATRLGKTEVYGVTYFEPAYGSQPKAEVKLIQLNEDKPRYYILESTGEVGNISRTVIKRFTLDWRPGIDLDDLMSVHAHGKINLKNGTISGPIASNSTDEHPIVVDGNPQIDDYYILPGTISNPRTIDAPDWWLSSRCGEEKQLDEPRIYPPIDFPVFPEVTEETSRPVISGGELVLTSPVSYIPEIRLNNEAVTIKYREGQLLIVDEIHVPGSNNDAIKLEGTGLLKIFVRNDFTIGGSGRFNVPATASERQNLTEEECIEASNKLAFYYDGPRTFSMTGNNIFNGSIFINSADIHLSGSGSGRDFTGNIVSNGDEVRLLGGVGVVAGGYVVYAPGSHVTLSGSGDSVAAIISDTFTLDGGSRVMFDAENSTPLPNPFQVTIDDLLPIEGPVREK